MLFVCAMTTKSFDDFLDEVDETFYGRNDYYELAMQFMIKVQFQIKAYLPIEAYPFVDHAKLFWEQSSESRTQEMTEKMYEMRSLAWKVADKYLQGSVDKAKWRIIISVFYPKLDDHPGEVIDMFVENVRKIADVEQQMISALNDTFLQPPNAI